MRLTAIRAHHCAGLRTAMLTVDPAAPVVLLAGPNGAGKTALLEGIRLVLSGELPRGLRYKKDLPLLITAGEKDGWVGLSLASDGRTTEHKVSLKTGNPVGDAAPPLGGGLYTLVPAAFVALEPAARRKVLFERTGQRLTADTVQATLGAEGHDARRVAAIGPALGAGFDHAARRAKELASEARGAWQAVTGETFGDKKALDWAATAPVSWDDPETTGASVRQAQRALTAASQLLRGLEDAEGQHARSVALGTTAGALPRITADLADFTAQLEAERAALATAERAAVPAATGWECGCPACGVLLRSPAPGTLVEATPRPVTAPQAGAAAEAHRAKIRALEDRLRKLRTEETGARAAQLALDTLPERPSGQELADARAAHARALEAHAEAERVHRAAEAAQAEAASADARTATARKHAADVFAYTALAEAVTALPARFLTQALATLNAALAEASKPFAQVVRLGEDMELRYGAHPYGLLSRSEQLRCVLALGLALGQKDGGIVLVDEFDLVQPADRPPILAALAAQDRVQVVLGATLKAPPALPAGCGVDVHWLGRAAAPAAAAA